MMADLRRRSGSIARRCACRPAEFARLADAATREEPATSAAGAEMEERESRAIARLLHEARRRTLPTAPAVAATLRTLAEGEYVRAEPRGWHRKTHPPRAWRRRLASGAGSGSPPHRADPSWRKRHATAPGARPMGAARPDLHHELGYTARRTACELTGHRRPGGEGGLLRMVAGDPQPAAVQGADRPAADRHIITTGTDSYRFRRTRLTRRQ